MLFILDRKVYETGRISHYNQSQDNVFKLPPGMTFVILSRFVIRTFERYGNTKKRCVNANFRWEFKFMPGNQTVLCFTKVGPL